MTGFDRDLTGFDRGLTPDHSLHFWVIRGCKKHKCSHHTHKWYLLRIIFQPYFSYSISCHCRRASIHRTCHGWSDQRICHVHKNSPLRLRFFCTYFTIELKNHKPQGGCLSARHRHPITVHSCLISVTYFQQLLLPLIYGYSHSYDL